MGKTPTEKELLAREKREADLEIHRRNKAKLKKEEEDYKRKLKEARKK